MNMHKQFGTVLKDEIFVMFAAHMAMDTITTSQVNVVVCHHNDMFSWASTGVLRNDLLM